MINKRLKSSASALAGAVAVSIMVIGTFHPIQAQQPQIPTLQVCNLTDVDGDATVRIAGRADARSSGTFRVQIKLKCDPARGGVPEGELVVSEISMSDSTIQVAFKGVVFEQVTSTGKHTPMAFLNGRCDWHGTPCRFWILLADNKQPDQRGTPDVIGFLVLDSLGHRMAYGAGPVVTGDIKVASSN